MQQRPDQHRGTGGPPTNQDPEDETTTISEDLEKMNIDDQLINDWVFLGHDSDNQKSTEKTIKP